VTRNRAHLEVVCYDEMLVAQFLAQQSGHDVVIQRRRLEQATCNFLSDVDVGEAAVTDHHTTHTIVTSLKEFDVGREIL
jgi:hypothetical protein